LISIFYLINANDVFDKKGGIFMRDTRKVRKFLRTVLFLSVNVVILGCSFISGLTSKSKEPPVPISTQSSATQVIAPTDQTISTADVPTEEPVPTTTSPTQESPVILDRPLGAGPWLLIVAEDGMWAVNPDGSGLTSLTDELPITAQDLRKSASPSGGAFALVTTTNPDKMANLTLKLLHLPDGDLEIVTPLTSDETEPGPDALPGSEDYEVVFGLSGMQNLAWSPDGDQLAFMGAMNGPSSDLYLYTLDSGEITQLTDGPSQGIRPTWSPDGAYIVHTGVGSFGTGAGYDVQGIWAAEPNGSILTLYPIPDESGDEEILGWVSPRRFLVYTWNVVCGTKNLRIYDIDSGKTEVLWKDFFSSVVFSPQTKTGLVSIDEWTVDCNPGGSEGSFLLRSGQAMPLKVLDFGSYWMDWYPSAGVYLVKNESQMFAVGPDGEVKRLADAPGADLPAVSADGRMWAFAESTQGGSQGLWLGEFGSETESYFPRGTRDVTWAPGSEGFFFFSESGLYFAPAPSFEPVLIGEGLHVSHVEPTVWVFP
jgi:WD40 repeat protein